jgi:hypothetical protein
LNSQTKYYASGSLVADSHEQAQGLMVITSGQIGVELPMDSEEAEAETNKENGSTLLHILKHG